MMHHMRRDVLSLERSQALALVRSMYPNVRQYNRIPVCVVCHQKHWDVLARSDSRGHIEQDLSQGDSGSGYLREDIHEWYYSGGEEEIDHALINQDWSAIRNTMWNYAGIIRTNKRLERARADLDYLRHRIVQFYRAARMDPKIVGLKHGIQVAMLITQSALGNPISRGAHFITGGKRHDE